MHKNVVSAKNK